LASRRLATNWPLTGWPLGFWSPDTINCTKSGTDPNNPLAANPPAAGIGYGLMQSASVIMG
jgi:hypothetical protein